MFGRKSSCEYSIHRLNLTYRSLQEKRNLSQEDLTVAKCLYLYIYKINLFYLLIFFKLFLTVLLQVLFNATNTITILILGGGQC